MTIAIDFDGVIHAYSKGWNGGAIYDPPVPGTREAMQALRDKGYKIYIFSTRSNKMFRKKDEIDQDTAMKAYLAEHEIPYDKIWTFGKPMADIYLDDRAIGFRGDWNAALTDINNFVPWTKEENEG
jgi:FMN phosphatase YigB (HAD superfamily)